MSKNQWVPATEEEKEKYHSADLLFPSAYLKSVDLDGKDVTLTIRDWHPRHKMKTQRGTEQKPALVFEKTDKILVLNKTNKDTISAMYGKEMKDWVGQRITVYPTRVPFQGSTTMAIRIRESIPTTKKAAKTESASSSTAAEVVYT